MAWCVLVMVLAEEIIRFGLQMVEEKGKVNGVIDTCVISILWLVLQLVAVPFVSTTERKVGRVMGRQVATPSLWLSFSVCCWLAMIEIWSSWYQIDPRSEGSVIPSLSRTLSATHDMPHLLFLE